MSDFPLKRTLFLSIPLFLAAQALFAGYPTARFDARIVYVPTLSRAVLFGGQTSVDSGTKQAYALGDTWEWFGQRWVQRFPAHSPSPRGGQAMVYDSNRDRIVLFGGRNQKTYLNDTWVYKDGDWTLLDTPNAPPARDVTAFAFDPIRDRLVIFGGSQLSADGKSLVWLHDTWEFDGTTWTQIGGEGPNATKPLAAYDGARNQVVMLADNDKGAPVMYTYDPAVPTWNAVTPATLPACIDGGALVFQSSNGTLFYTGGICTGSSSTEDNYEWDGTTWNKLTTSVNSGRLLGAAITFDSGRNQPIIFGGTNIAAATTATTLAYSESVGWFDVGDSFFDPAPRSLFVFTNDPVSTNIWLFGGVNGTGRFADLWRFQNGLWQDIIADSAPQACDDPVGSWDTDRQTLVLLCSTSATLEFNGAAWKTYSPKNSPPTRRWSSMVYDQSLHKTVLFGGWNGNYIDETWLWDGTNWTRESHNPPQPRDLAAMWYDPNLHKTVIYGGLGRQSSQDKLVRFDDMWTFDGTGWTELKPTGGTPGMRYGAQVAVDPRTNHAVLFGGLRVDMNGLIQTQVYADDTWEWDGSTWVKLSPDLSPPPRENGGLTFDPARNELVLFGGYNGAYLSDAWGYSNGTWHRRVESLQRRRGVRR